MEYHSILTRDDDIKQYTKSITRTFKKVEDIT